ARDLAAMRRGQCNLEETLPTLLLLLLPAAPALLLLLCRFRLRDGGLRRRLGRLVVFCFVLFFSFVFVFGGVVGLARGERLRRERLVLFLLLVLEALLLLVLAHLLGVGVFLVALGAIGLVAQDALELCLCLARGRRDGLGRLAAAHDPAGRVHRRREREDRAPLRERQADVPRIAVLRSQVVEEEPHRRIEHAGEHGDEPGVEPFHAAEREPQDQRVDRDQVEKLDEAEVPRQDAVASVRVGREQVGDAAVLV